MRQFHSYGPVDVQEHFCVERKELIQKCSNQLIGRINKGGSLFYHLGTQANRQNMDYPTKH